MSSDADFSADAFRAEEPAQPAPLSQRDRALAAALANTSQLVGRLLADEELTDLMRVEGYDAAELQTAVTLQAAAEDVFRKHCEAQAAMERVQAEYTECWTAAREEYLEFRWVLRQVFPMPAAQQALDVHVPVSVDLPGFLTQAAASYRSMQMLRTPEVLAEAGFGAERVSAALAGLRQLGRLELALHASRSRAARFHDEQELAMAMLNLWLREFYRAAQSVIPEHEASPAAALPSSGRQHRRAEPPVRSGGLAHRLRWRRSPRRFWQD